ncbi:MAG: GGDEF domain-containing protein [Pontibacterium sp.]
MDANKQTLSIEEVHWHLGLLQNLDVGLIVMDHQYQVHLWNSFMSNHSGIGPAKIRENSIFELFPELPAGWLRRKLDTVFQLKSPVYITWEQRPYLFEFKSHRPITGPASLMYQNITMIPLTSPSGEVDYVGIIIYDVTDTAENKLALQDVNVQLQSLSREDRLTGLFNRGHWEECLERELNRYLRTYEPCTLIMLDIDHFKAVNDTYGHPAGDEVIRRVAAMLLQHARKTDIVGRYGGEEFGIILTSTNTRQAGIVAERMRQAIEMMEVEYEQLSMAVTISLGLAELQPDILDHEQWITQADNALYKSKEKGRNQYNIYAGE